MSGRAWLVGAIGLLVAMTGGACSSQSESEKLDEQSEALGSSDAGACPDVVVLEATRTYGKHPKFFDGVASFHPAIALVVPSEVPIVAGASDRGRLKLTIENHHDKTICFYRGEPQPGTRYLFDRCSDEEEDDDDDDHDHRHGDDNHCAARHLMRV